MSSNAIGIDFGTTNSCVAVWQDDHTHVILNDQGNPTTPSCVSFSDTEFLVGDAAKNQAAWNPTNTIFASKRLMGRKFWDDKVQSDIKHFPFKVEEMDGKPVISVVHSGETKIFTPEEISAMILLKLKQRAESYLGTKVSDAVIAVPTYCRSFERQAFKQAGVISGLNILHVIADSTAVAYTYNIDMKVYEVRNVLIYDLGGGSISVSLFTMEEGILEVKATAGDGNLGGVDFDNRLVNHFAAQFKRKNKMDLSTDPRALRRLRTACERAKRSLSSATQASIEIESLFGGIDFYSSLTRARFEELCHDLFRSTLEPVEKVLRDARIDKTDVQDIVLVGASTRIPRIIKLVSDFFNGKRPNRSINPEEAVAYGAAIRAGFYTTDASELLQDMLLLDVTPASIGIETADGVFAAVIKRNTTIPTKKSEIFVTSSDNQTGLLLKIYEGERARTKNNTMIGQMAFLGIPPAPRGVSQIEITFDIDARSRLHVTVADKTTGKSKFVEISGNGDGLTEEEERMVREGSLPVPIIPGHDHNKQ